jgi:hypothetical protein
MSRFLTPGHVAVVAAVVVAAAFAGTARAAVTVSLTNCGTANGGFQFTVNGSGFIGVPGLNVEIVTSEPGASPNPNYVLPPGAPNLGVLPAADLNPDGSFTLTFGSGWGQLLPATIDIYSFDAGTLEQGALLFSIVVSAATVCADSTNLSSAHTTLPATTADCKAEGWKTYGVFKSQGDCVSFLTTRGKNPPALLP